MNITALILGHILKTELRCSGHVPTVLEDWHSEWRSLLASDYHGANIGAYSKSGTAVLWAKRIWGYRGEKPRKAVSRSPQFILSRVVRGCSHNSEFNRLVLWGLEDYKRKTKSSKIETLPTHSQFPQSLQSSYLKNSTTTILQTNQSLSKITVNMKFNLATILATTLAVTVTAAPANEAVTLTTRGKSR